MINVSCWLGDQFLVHIFKAPSSGRRIAIRDLLRGGDKIVSEVLKGSGVERGNVFHSLNLTLYNPIINREGKGRIYLNRETMGSFFKGLDKHRFLIGPLSSISNISMIVRG